MNQQLEWRSHDKPTTARAIFQATGSFPVTHPMKTNNQLTKGAQHPLTGGAQRRQTNNQQLEWRSHDKPEARSADKPTTGVAKPRNFHIFSRNFEMHIRSAFGNFVPLNT